MRSAGNDDLGPTEPKTDQIAQKVGVSETITGHFVPGRLDMGSGLLGIFVGFVSCLRPRVLFCLLGCLLVISVAYLSVSLACLLGCYPGCVHVNPVVCWLSRFLACLFDWPGCLLVIPVACMLTRLLACYPGLLAC